MAGVPGFDEIGSDELFKLVWRDDLTGLYNRRFYARYMKQVADWAPGAPPIALAMMDMDNLKRINDRLGHMQGDAALKRIGQIMLETAEESHYAIRYAGDEFCVVFPDTSREQAVVIAERLREAVVKDAYTDAELPEALRPSLSIGIAVFPADAPSGGDALTEAADKALYYSKRTGKNKVTCAADLRKGEEVVSDIDALSGFPSQSLVGREQAFKAVDEAFGLVQDNKNGFLLIEGEGGTGKTRLLAEIGKYARERRVGVMIERCSAANREEPYKTIGGLLDAYLRGNATLLADVATGIDVQQKVALSEVLKIFKDLVPRRRPQPRPRPAEGTQNKKKKKKKKTGSTGQRRPPPPSERLRRSGPPGSGVRPPQKRRPQSRRDKRPQRPSGESPALKEGTKTPGPRKRPDARKTPTPRRVKRAPKPERSEHSTQRRVRPLRSRVAPAMTPAELTAALFGGIIDLLHLIARKQPVVILLDDIHSADAPTLEVITRLLPLPGKLLFVGCARTSKASSDEEGNETSPYAAFRQQLGEHPSATVAELGPLDEAQTTELATQLLDGYHPPLDFAEKIFALSKGNPLFVEGVLRHLVDTSVLEQGEEGWGLARDVPGDLPLTLETLVRGQLKILDPELAKLIERAAVVGPNFEFNVLQASLADEQSEAETLEFVEEAVTANVLRETGAEAGSADLEFSSKTVQEAAYDGIEPAEREKAHRKVAEALPDEDAAAKAFHFDRAGDHKKRDRFLREVRERQDLVFDHEAVESLLLDSRKGKIPEVTKAPPPELFAALPVLAKHIAHTVRVSRLYPPSSKVVSKALSALVKTLKKVHQLAPAFTISHRGNSFIVNGSPVDPAFGTGQFQEAVVSMYRANSIKSLTFMDPPRKKELHAFLAEVAKHTVQVQLERYYWAVFAHGCDFKSLGVQQKINVLKRRANDDWSRAKVIRSRVASRNLDLVKDLVANFMGAVKGLRKAGKRAGGDSEEVPKELAKLDRSLRLLFERAPALAIHVGRENSIVVNGTQLETSLLGPDGLELLILLRVCRLHGVVVLPTVTPKELGRFLSLVGQISPKDFESGKDPVQEMGADATLPNVLVGDALYQLAHDLVRRAKPTETDDEPGGPAQDDEASLQEFLDRVLPLLEREDDLPPDFEWPSDALAKRARTLFSLKPHELLASQGTAEYVEVLERLLMDDRGSVAKRLVHRMAINFASSDTHDRKRCAELFLTLAAKASQDLRARYFELTVLRLADALELETDFEVFEKLAECARIGILDRVSDADWDTAARLVWSLSRRREARVEAQARLKKVSQRILGKVLNDPRAERVFETIETGSQQERRKAARILEGMGTAAVDRLVSALRRTQRSRVEHFLIDMLAALAPESDLAIQKEVTASSAPDETKRLLRAAAVVCQDPTVVLVSGLQNDDTTVQAEAVAVARSIGHNAAQNVLRWALAHGSPTVQLEAVKHLGELSRPDTVDSLLDLLQGTNLVEVQRECCLAFGKLALNRSHHERVVPVLTNFLRAGGLLRSEYHQDVRAAAAWSLGQMKSSDPARRALEKALDDKDKRVRLTAKLTLEGRSL
jgi:diguanylate cyclase (GGDEF)-like protein